MLFDYARQVRRFLKDPRMQHIDEPDIVSYVNRARREVALRTQSIRRVPPIAGSILEIQVLNPGQGYTNPNVVISPPDSPGGALPNAGGGQARATALQVAGQIANVSVVYGGDGYFQPTAAITDPAGTGVQLKVVTTPINVTQIFQESYNFSDFPVSQFPGVKSVYSFIEASVIYANYRYTMMYYPFSVYQAMIRQYPRQYYYVPTMYTQFGQGTNGNLLMYPIASTQYQFEVDCLCLPADLTSDNEYEALPEPWTDAVPYMAAGLCYEELQNLNAATYYQKKYDEFVHKYSAYARPGRTFNPYGRW